jgi:type II secretory pathway pseudopilin PulG
MVAMAAVGALLVATVSAYTTTIRTASETEQLENLLSYVAARGSELTTLVAATNSSTQSSLQVPAAIGYKQYWLRARNDSSTAWIEGSFGEIVEKTAPNRVFLPKGTSASGYYVAGYGPAILSAYINGSTVQLKLASLGA